MNIDELSDAMMQALLEYDEEVEKLIDSKCEDKAKQCVNALKKHPNLRKLKGTGEYAKKFYKIKNGMGSYTVHNKKYQIAHLLEHGHALPTGGRTRAFPHWEDVQEIAEQLPDEIEVALNDQ